ncbi:hemerythrin domain-containing protein [Jannaschia aquimarina]|uniref:Hemerythrin HHE cation binding domain protein n=1 Tax=Jannaschia aquimarina TaxID=935700 RepID=A0A0D1EBG1_9RHOB|nr:hemerythrin domain-containing protein [Jannaschia aquimarina]KIT14241.1 Hemerythrin HHE cation binding domain protein [Jannaschia aquimarina]SNS49015.1 Hemerythrin-like domain-containing protein [Jannaschia aquimarina]
MDGSLDLATRDGLPEALRVLLAEMPRSGWQDHPEYGPLTQFWLERHLNFRRLLDLLQGDLTARVDGKLDPRDHAARLSRLGGMFLGELQQHHTIEDQVYFPKLAAHAPELARGFELLDADHHALHEELEGFATEANAVLRGEAAAPLEARVAQMHRFLDRHLTDEEEIVVPVILKVGEGHL